MITKRFYFKNIISNYTEDSYFEAFINDSDEEFHISKRKGLIVIPGGAYVFLSYRESQPVACLGCANGYNCFVLNYTCKKPYPTPHLELGAMVNYIMEHKDDFCLTDEELTFVGFSAGGHLLASFSYLYEEIAKILNIDSAIIKPRKIGLAYPVISMKMPTSSSTSKIITDNHNPKLVNLLSVEEHISDDYPKTFVFSSESDKVVPFKHSKIFANSLRDNHVEHKFILYKTIDHGISIANDATCIKKESFLEAKDWFNEMLSFLN